MSEELPAESLLYNVEGHLYIKENGQIKQAFLNAWPVKWKEGGRFQFSIIDGVKNFTKDIVINFTKDEMRRIPDFIFFMRMGARL